MNNLTNKRNRNRVIARNTIVLYIRMFFTMGISLYTSRMVLATLGVTDYGIYNVVGGVVAMFNVINNAMASSTQRFMTFELGSGDIERLSKVFSISIRIHLKICLLIIFLAETMGLWFVNTQLIIPEERMIAANWAYQMSVISACIGIMSVPYNAAIIAHEKMSAFAYISVMDVLLKLAIVYLLVISSCDKLIFYSFLLLLVSALSRCVYGIYCKRRFKECTYKRKMDKFLSREMISFAGWGLFGNCSAFASTHGVNLLLNTFFSPAINAARGVAVQVQMAIQNLSSNFQVAINPQITLSYASKELDRTKKLIYVSSRYSFYMVYIISLPMIIGANEILSVWLKVVPEHSVNFLRIILCTAMIDVLANPIITAAGATGKIKRYQTIVGTINLMIVPLSYIALKVCAIPELVFMVHFCMASLAQGTRIYLIRPMIKMPLRKYFKNVVLRIMVVVSISSMLSLVAFIFFTENEVLAFLAKEGICVISIVLCVYAFGMERKERNMVVQKIKSLVQLGHHSNQHKLM